MKGTSTSNSAKQKRNSVIKRTLRQSELKSKAGSKYQDKSHSSNLVVVEGVGPMQEFGKEIKARDSTESAGWGNSTKGYDHKQNETQKALIFLKAAHLQELSQHRPSEEEHKYIFGNGILYPRIL